MKLANDVALVTGGGSGIGRAICQRLHREGATVFVNDIDRDTATETAKALGIGSRNVLVADVSRSEEVRSMFTGLAHLDILVNNAGIADPPERWNATEVTTALDDERWRLMIAVHLDGTFYCTREALKLMKPRRRGAIINLSSTAALTGLADAPHYAAAKAGIIGFTRSVAREVGPFGIRVNAIAPGYVSTPMTEGAPASTVSRVPLGRWATPEEIAEAALFLAGDASAYITGECLSPNGGLVM